MTKAELITIANIIRTRGNRGEVVAEILTDFPNRFEFLTEVFLQKNTEPPRCLTLDSFWFHKQRVILKFTGIDSISAAEVLRDHEVKIPKREVIPLEEGSYYQHELVDCVVKDVKGNKYGMITNILDTGAGYLLRVNRDSGELLIPFAASMLVEIDLEKKELICSLPEGLEDL